MLRPSRIRLLVVDDHPAFRAGLVAILEAEPDMSVVAQAGDGEQAITACREHCPDVVLMDLRLPRLGGVEATMRITQEMPGLHVVALTTYDGDEDIHRALRAGARSYMLKDAGADELVAMIRAVQAGEAPLPGTIAARLVQRLQRPELSARERDVVQLLARGHSNKEIGSALAISEDTVKASRPAPRASMRRGATSRACSPSSA